MTCARLLLGAGASQQTRRSCGCRALHTAATHDRAECAAALLSASSADVEALSCKGNTPLSIAAHHSHEATVSVLLAAGADVAPECSNALRGTALHAAADGAVDSRGLAVIRRLVAAGADVTAVDADGDTPRAVALQAQNHRAARLLLELERQQGKPRDYLQSAML